MPSTLSTEMQYLVNLTNHLKAGGTQVRYHSVVRALESLILIIIKPALH